MKTIQKGDLVLVTGFTGYIGSHIAEELILSGYRVRGTTRVAKKAQWLIDYLTLKFGPGKIEVVEIPDMTRDRAFDDAMVGVTGVIHVASVMTFAPDPQTVIEASLAGTLNVYESARRVSSVKSVVYTSSAVAYRTPKPDEPLTITKDTFNDAALKIAYEPGATGYDVYSASKTRAERALWDAYRQHSPSFQLSSVLPDCTFGGHIGVADSRTGRLILDLYSGKDWGFDLPPQWFVHVVDVARLHVAALADPASHLQRYFAATEPFNWNDILAIFRKWEPEGTFLEDRKLGRDLSVVPNGDAEDLLKKHYGHGWRTLEESIIETVRWGLAQDASGKNSH